MLSEDQVNHIINEQEETIASLRDKLLAMEDERDLAIGKGLELIGALRQIECRYESSDDIKTIATRAIDAYQAK